MKTLIMRACEQTGRQVVVLIDEYMMRPCWM